MAANQDTLSLLIERGTTVKINGLAKQLNTNLTINVPKDFLDDHEILEIDRAEMGL